MAKVEDTSTLAGKESSNRVAYAVVREEGTLLVVATTRDVARNYKSQLGGKRGGYTIHELHLGKEVR